MTGQLVFESMRIEELRGLAQILAPYLRKGDVIALEGDLGAGKTTFARFLIRYIAGEEVEVSSPSFPLVQSYYLPRLRVFHFDFYRLSDVEELDELGFDDALSEGLVLIEWPERIGDSLPADRLEIVLEETADPQARRVTIRGMGGWQRRLERFRAATAFLKRAGWGAASCEYLAGDASVRSYIRVKLNGRSALLMDWERQPDGPPLANGLPYSRIAHLAEGVGPFVAVAKALRRANLAVPEIYAADVDNGFLLIEDFGDRVLGREVEAGGDMMQLYWTAVEQLLRLRSVPIEPQLPILNGTSHELPTYDRDALHIETELLLDWFLPAISGAEVDAGARARFHQLWESALQWLEGEETGWVLRDFHSPNLIWRENDDGRGQLGIIDFQDAVRGHPAYDLVSLLQDARLDVPAPVEAQLFTRYCAEASRNDPAFDPVRFRRAYAMLGAQRNTKILGIFARLALRDGKRGYIRHMPRVRRYLERDLAHPALAQLRMWYERYMPRAIDQGALSLASADAPAQR